MRTQGVSMHRYTVSAGPCNRGLPMQVSQASTCACSSSTSACMHSGISMVCEQRVASAWGQRHVDAYPTHLHQEIPRRQTRLGEGDRGAFCFGMFRHHQPALFPQQIRDLVAPRWVHRRMGGIVQQLAADATACASRLARH